jgi:hypothetical protein
MHSHTALCETSTSGLAQFHLLQNLDILLDQKQLC